MAPFKTTDTGICPCSEAQTVRVTPGSLPFLSFSSHFYLSLFNLFVSLSPPSHSVVFLNLPSLPTFSSSAFNLLPFILSHVFLHSPSGAYFISLSLNFSSIVITLSLPFFFLQPPGAVWTGTEHEDIQLHIKNPGLSSCVSPALTHPHPHPSSPLLTLTLLNSFCKYMFTQCKWMASTAVKNWTNSAFYNMRLLNTFSSHHGNLLARDFRLFHVHVSSSFEPL